MKDTCILVADLAILIDARDHGINFKLPVCHKLFVSNRPPSGGLYLRIYDGIPQKKDTWQALYHTPEIWELWQDESGKFIFILPDNAPPKRHIVVDPGFRTGEVVGEFSGKSDIDCIEYPLQNIEIKLFINWLAGFGDIILHAVGVRVDGRGYCFAGKSGAGKSTLAEALVEIPGVEILGEDNIVLRYKDNQFFIYGTPWHLNFRMCSNNKAPLEKLFFLDRSNDPEVVKCDPLQGITRLMQTAFVPYYRPETLPYILERLNLLSSRVPFGLAHYQLGSDPGAFFNMN